MRHSNDLRVKIILQCSDRSQSQHKPQCKARLSSLVNSYQSPHDKSEAERTSDSLLKEPFDAIPYIHGRRQKGLSQFQDFNPISAAAYLQLEAFPVGM